MHSPRAWSTLQLTWTYLNIDKFSEPVGSAYDFVESEDDEDEDDDIQREEGISFPSESGLLGANGRSISLDPGALAGKHMWNCVKEKEL